MEKSVIKPTIADLLSHKDEFQDIFKSIQNGFNLSFHDWLNYNLKEWTASRINGASASMAFYISDIKAIKLIDKISSELKQ